jgi:DNA alkylation damage repair protein AlkB
MDLFGEPRAPLAPGAYLFRARLTPHEQRDVTAQLLALGAADGGFYTPVVRGGHPMSVKMLCLGRHWNARTYSYETLRSDVDGKPVPPLPAGLTALARAIANEAGFDMSPDICIVNWYGAASRMGLHQDKDESAESLDRGVPVVSLSIGDTARFLFGGLKRKDPVQKIELESGDAFVFGGPARRRYHGVAGIVPHTGPAGLGFEGRLNLTFRQF